MRTQTVGLDRDGGDGDALGPEEKQGEAGQYGEDGHARHRRQKENDGGGRDEGRSRGRRDERQDSRNEKAARRQPAILRRLRRVTDQSPDHEDEADGHRQKYDPDRNADGNELFRFTFDADEGETRDHQGGRHADRDGRGADAEELPKTFRQQVGGRKREQAIQPRRQGGSEKRDEKRQVLHDGYGAGDSGSTGLSRGNLEKRQGAHQSEHDENNDVLESSERLCHHVAPQSQGVSKDTNSR